MCDFLSLIVKDYQLIQSQDSTTVSLPGHLDGQGSPKTLLSRYLTNFTAIISHLLQASEDNSSPDAVEASWVLSLALKGLYNTLKVSAMICNFGDTFNFDSGKGTTGVATLDSRGFSAQSMLFMFHVEARSRAGSGGHPAVGSDPAAGEEVQQRDRLQQALVAERSGNTLHHAVLLKARNPFHGPGS